MTTSGIGSAHAVAAIDPALRGDPVQLKTTIELPDIPLRELSMTLRPDASRVVIEVIDSETKAVLRQIPSNDAMDPTPARPAVRGSFLDEQG